MPVCEPPCTILWPHDVWGGGRNPPLIRKSYHKDILRWGFQSRPSRQQGVAKQSPICDLQHIHALVVLARAKGALEGVGWVEENKSRCEERAWGSRRHTVGGNSSANIKAQMPGGSQTWKNEKKDDGNPSARHQKWNHIIVWPLPHRSLGQSKARASA
ncbi:hypothetical protein B0H19DRAFT_1081797 [Mycena capillaripes]|nr:hypothetical protein B0H19DRAFT_1081797 [Mycena capillaripes]